ncbi:MAG: TIGR02757 family protein [Thermodesulfobacteriota bacterium]|nr:MAG: TIGR02757 family protein [Thermodesulfobacteriota bacterium]
MSRKKNLLKDRLERLYRTFDRGFLSTDPLEFVHHFSDPADREIVGLISSSLAYGRVKGIRNSIEKVMSVMGGSPYRFTRGFTPKSGRRLFSGFKHRFNTGDDIACLIYFARQMIDESGSIGGFFMKGYSPSDRNVRKALEKFSANALALDAGAIYGSRSKRLPGDAGVRFFFPSPARGGACKRLNLYLRWMVRRDDGLDFGQWTGVEPSKLVIPLDTHIARISRNIGLTARKTQDWKMAEEITEGLKALDVEDPVRYDFSLCRLGILEQCPSRVDRVKCESCLIKKICVL